MLNLFHIMLVDREMDREKEWCNYKMEVIIKKDGR